MATLKAEAFPGVLRVAWVNGTMVYVFDVRGTEYLRRLTNRRLNEIAEQLADHAENTGNPTSMAGRLARVATVPGHPEAVGVYLDQMRVGYVPAALCGVIKVGGDVDVRCVVPLEGGDKFRIRCVFPGFAQAGPVVVASQ